MNKLIVLLTIVLAFSGCSKSDNEDGKDYISTLYDDCLEIEGLVYGTRLSESNAVLDIKKGDLSIGEITWPIKGGTLQTFNSIEGSINKKIEGVYIQDYKVNGDNVYILIRYLDKDEQNYGIHEILHIKDNRLVKNSFIKKQITNNSGIPYQLKEWYDGSIIVLNNPTINPNENGYFFLLFDKNHNLLLDDQSGFPTGEYIVDMYRELYFSVASVYEGADVFNKQRVALIYQDIRNNKLQWINEIYKGDLPAKITSKEISVKDNMVIGNVQYTLENGDKRFKDLKIDLNTGEDI